MAVVATVVELATAVVVVAPVVTAVAVVGTVVATVVAPAVVAGTIAGKTEEDGAADAALDDATEKSASAWGDLAVLAGPDLAEEAGTGPVSERAVEGPVTALAVEGPVTALAVEGPVTALAGTWDAEGCGLECSAVAEPCGYGEWAGREEGGATVAGLIERRAADVAESDSRRTRGVGGFGTSAPPS